LTSKDRRNSAFTYSLTRVAIHPIQIFGFDQRFHAKDVIDGQNIYSKISIRE